MLALQHGRFIYQAAQLVDIIATVSLVPPGKYSGSPPAHLLLPRGKSWRARWQVEARNEVGGEWELDDIDAGRTALHNLADAEPERNDADGGPVGDLSRPRQR